MAMRTRATLSPISASVLRRLSSTGHCPPHNVFQGLSFSANASENDREPKSLESSKVLSFIRHETNPRALLQYFERYAENPSFRQNLKAYEVATRKLAVAKAPDFVEEIVEKLLDADKPCTEQEVIHVMILYGRAAMPYHVIRTFEKLEHLGISPTIRIFNTLLASLVESRNPSKALDFFHRADDFGITKNVVSFNIAMNALCSAADYNAAIELLKSMKDSECEPTSISYYTILDSVYNDSKIEKEKKNELLDLLIESCNSEAISYSLRIRRFCKEMRVRESRNLFDLAVSKNLVLDRQTVDSLIIALCKDEQIEEAMRIFDLYRERGSCAQCYNVLTRCLIKEGQFERAVQLFEEMLQKNWVPDSATVNVLLRYLLDSNKSMTKTGRTLIKRMRSSLPPQFLKKWEERLRMYA
eukprot:TRINITY_DN6069_c0_g1_i1.p1 TRINITY_DN6069_c0_g1~~TRINITY_DN6069_c0_g1_i1.p1  ORF type:complete len:414 (-),score=21.21 TRINITY_DN6069_c0_g1_i1:145-1386(-)